MTFFVFLFMFWFLVYGPSMLAWWQDRKVRRYEIADLEAATCVEDMFGDKK